jgi:hypothetical protein
MSGLPRRFIAPLTLRNKTPRNDGESSILSPKSIIIDFGEE